MRTAWRIISAQVLAGLCAAALWALHSWEAALAAAGGAVVAIVPAAYLAWRMAFALRLKQEPKALVRAVFRGEMGKLLLTGLLFALVVARFPQQFLPVMTAFMGCLAMYWIASFATNDEITTDNDGQR